jgi:molybdenum cofactor biosynthesis enzyme
MKRYIEAKAVKTLFFRAYFLYGRSKYGSAERGDIRLARIAACSSVMQLCRSLPMEKGHIPFKEVEVGFAQLKQQVERLGDGTFKHTCLETLEAFASSIL